MSSLLGLSGKASLFVGELGGESQVESIGGLGKECVGMGKVWKGEGARLWVNGRVQESKSIRV